jgi:hypothetical protein
MDIRKIVMILFVIMFSFACYAQTDDVIKRDSSKFILNPSNFYSFKVLGNPSIPALSYSFLHDNSSSYILYYDSFKNHQLFYNDKPKKVISVFPLYPYNDYKSELHPLYPYHNFQSALICGSLNYLLLLFSQHN